jgi:general secretion pathway protein E
MQTPRLGELLVSRGLVSEQELADALAMQALIGGLLGQLLIRIGALSENDLNQLLSEQLGLKVLDNEETPTAAQVGKFIGETRAPIPWWMNHQAAAWRTGEAPDSPVIVAAVDPLDPALGDQLAQLGAGPVQLRLATHAAVTGLLASVASGADEAAGPDATEEAARLRDLAQETPAVDFVDGVFAEALSRRASDIHVEPFADHFAVRLRIDGVLVTIRTAPRARFEAVCARLKLLSGLNVGERRRPQVGRQSIRAAGQELDWRVSSLPSLWGESLVLRLLGRVDRLPKLAELGVGDAQAAKLLALVEQPSGLVLVSGPSDSGKTTTLYRLLVHLNNGARKIVTVEDPVEFELPGVVQVQAGRDLGLSVAAGMRSVLRQDPDVVMVGEIDDEETARLAVQAALSGHLVISTVAAGSALAAAHRLVDLDVEPSLLADVLRGVVGQRLVRRLCPNCSHPSDPDRIASYEALAADDVQFDGAAAWREPIGCPQCAQSGYQGRLGLYEIAEITPDLGRELEEGASEEAITHAARAAGFQSLFDDGYAKARAGLTSLAEVRRAVGGEPAPSLADA